MGKMATYIENVEDFIEFNLIPKLLKELSEKVKTLIKINIRQNTNISTETLQDYVTYQSNNKDSIIYIDFELMSTLESSPPVFSDMKYYGKNNRGKVSPYGLVEWGRFTNTYGGRKGKIGDRKWGKDLITFKLADWLEKGGVGNVGNQPIIANRWFTNTIQQIETNLDHWVSSFFEKYGFKVSKRR